MRSDMASQIDRPKVLGNFRPTATDRLKAKRNRDPRAEREGNDEDHLAAIRCLPCCVNGCNRLGNLDPHHLKAGTNERAMGMRSSDRWAVPMCRAHHEAVERIGSRRETKWFQDHGIEHPLDLAAALWRASPDRPRMTRIVLVHKGLAREAVGR